MSSSNDSPQSHALDAMDEDIDEGQLDEFDDPLEEGEHDRSAANEGQDAQNMFAHVDEEMNNLSLANLRTVAGQPISKWVKDFTSTAKMTLTFDGEHASEKSSLQDDLDALLAHIEINGAILGTPMQARTLILYQALRGQALQKFQSLWLKRDSAIPFKVAVNLLQGMAQDTRQGPIAMTADILKVKLLRLATSRGKVEPLVVAMGRLDEMIRNRKHSFDPVTLCYIYLNSLPAEMYEKVRFDITHGISREHTDPEKLRKCIMGLSSVFAEIQAKVNKSDGRPGGTSVTANARPSKRPRFQAQQQTDRPRFSVDGIPEHKRFLNVNKGMSIYVAGLSAEERRELMKKGSCLLCKGEGHVVNDCPQKKKAFDDKRFFAFHGKRSEASTSRAPVKNARK